MKNDEAIKHLENMKWLKGYDNTIIGDEPLTDIIDGIITLLKEQEAEIERLKGPDCEHANHDGAGCLGYCGCEQDDEPIDACKQCEKYTGNNTEIGV